MTTAETPPRNGPTRRWWLCAVGGLGAASVIAQLVFMREMLGTFAGNEMVLGILLGNWLLLTGAGAWLGRASGRLKNRESAFTAALIFSAIAPPAQVFLLALLRSAVFGRGIQAGVTETVLASFVVLLPFCVASGWLLTLACVVVADKDPAAAIGRVYVADSVGSIAGGALFSFVLVRCFDHLAILFLPALLNLLLAGALAARLGKTFWLGVAAVLAAALMSVILFANADALATAIQFPGQHVVFRGNSPYGKLVVTESAGQYNFIENGLPLISTDNTQQVEETVHYAMAQRPDARRVLVVCGGVSGTTREILKYGAVLVTYVELDPLIIEAGSQFLPDNVLFIKTGEGPSKRPSIHFVNTDGRLFVKQTADRYDVIIVDVPDPSTSQLNRFYTAEFFGEVKRALADGGVLSFALGNYAEYASPELARLLASARRTLDTAFRNVLMIPGGRVFFLASDGPLHGDIAARIEAARVPTRLVNRHYLDAMLAPDRMEDMRRAAAQPAAVNRDFSPVLYYYHLLHWMSQYRVKFGLLEAALVALLAVYLVRLRAAPLAVFASGFAASGLEVVLLLAFQILYGSVYQQLGIIITVFMAGLAAGAFATSRTAVHSRSATGSEARSTPHDERGQDFPRYRRQLARLAFAIAAFAALLPPCLMALAHAGGGAGLLVVQTAMALLTLLLAALVGMQFPLASRLGAEDTAATASRLYTADFAGACLGALLPSTLLIPLLGVPAVCLCIAALNVLAGVALLLRKA
jgi:spermidine synthase